MTADYQPQWQGVFENYARKYAAANHWRVKHICDEVEDTIQQCAVVWLWCCKHQRCTNDGEFMKFYQRVLFNAFVDLTRISRGRAKIQALSVPFDPKRHGQIAYSDGPLAVTLAEASDELQQAIGMLTTAPPDLLQLLLPDQILQYGADKQAELSRSWCRFARTTAVRDDLLSELRMRL